MKLFHNFIYRGDTEKYSIMTHTFMVVTAVWGFAFTFLGSRYPSISDTILYSRMYEQVGIAGVQTWGIFAMTTLVIMTIAVMFKISEVGKFAAMGGYLLWIYAFTLYLSGAYWLHILVICFPNIVFWSSFYIDMQRIEIDQRIKLIAGKRTDWTEE